MAVTEDNFPKAWEILTSFYENKRLLVNAALQSLLNLKRMNRESALDLERLYIGVMQIYRSLESLKRPVETWDDFLVFLTVQRLDSESVKAWEHHLGSTTELLTWSKLMEFLVSRLRSLQAFERSRSSKPAFPSQPPTIRAHFQKGDKEKISDSSLCCPFCSANHYSFNCPQYRSKSLQQKLELISKKKLCYNCLGAHRVVACRSTKRCLKCGRKHHTSTHPGSSQTNKLGTDRDEQVKSEINPVSEPTQATHTLSAATVQTSRVLLATARVRIVSLEGNVTTVRALIDQGSEVSLITERIVQRLRMSRIRSAIPLTGIGGKSTNKTKGIVNFVVSLNFQSNYKCAVTAHILNYLTSPIPSIAIGQTSWPHLEGLQLADPQFFNPGSIDLILGADLYGSIIKEGILKGPLESPIAQCTNLGWIISGPTRIINQPTERLLSHVTLEDNLYPLLHRFWELEEIPTSSDHSITQEEQECLKHFETTHSRSSQGRYVVKLPFKKSTNLLGDSKGKAIHLINRLKYRFQSDQNYAQLYSEFMNEYATLRHMTLVPPSQPEPSAAFYLPHHGVLRESSLTTRLRVVFNGSSKTTSGISLNDLLHIGPNLQRNLFDVLVRFRQFRYAFCSDIEKMYRQIQVHPEDWKYQRILWINSDKSVDTYQLTTVTYGLACAPFLALNVISQLIKDEGEKFPMAVPVLTYGRYMDDLFGGADSIDQAQDLVNQVNQLCMAGGFRLQKWAANQAEVLHTLPEETKSYRTAVTLEGDPIIPALGISWQPLTDTFRFNFVPALREPVTKRTVLSTIAKLFDPLGLLSPIIIRAKIIMQEIWTLKINWDDPLPSATEKRWSSFIHGLKDLSSLSFPRWLGLKSKQPFEIHGFSDASPQAYSAVVYCRTTSENGTVKTQLICSKTKVAPLKRMTIPRLELTGATLLTKLVKLLLSIFDRHNIPIYLWTDSTVTYNWISQHPSRWKDFVHNRVCFIQETLPQAQWGLVPGQENPADLATRGLTPAQLSEQPSWWAGPVWLIEPLCEWPNPPTIMEKGEALEERPLKLTSMSIQPSEGWDLIMRYSSLKRLIRITALCIRALKRFQRIPNSSLLYPITTKELNTAKLFWVKTVQQITFHHELKVLSEKGPLPSSHPLTKLTPFLDINGVLRIGGRLQASSLSEDAKHPAILPRQSPLTTLIIADAHVKTLHGGTHPAHIKYNPRGVLDNRRANSSQKFYT